MQSKLLASTTTQSLAAAHAGDGTSTHMRNLDQEYGNLLAQLSALEAHADERFKTEKWTAEAEVSWLSKVDPLRDRMFEIAIQLTEMPIQTDQDLHTIAKVLYDFSNGDDSDVVHRLATALSVAVLKCCRS
jgi:hypothetical protein